MPETAAIESACETYRYNPRVLVAPPWKEIYSTDEERQQTFEDAVNVYQQMVQVYQRCGYELVELPRVSVTERGDFMLAQLNRRVLDRQP